MTPRSAAHPLPLLVSSLWLCSTIAPESAWARPWRSDRERPRTSRVTEPTPPLLPFLCPAVPYDPPLPEFDPELGAIPAPPPVSTIPSPINPPTRPVPAPPSGTIPVIPTPNESGTTIPAQPGNQAPITPSTPLPPPVVQQPIAPVAPPAPPVVAAPPTPAPSVVVPPQVPAPLPAPMAIPAPPVVAAPTIPTPHLLTRPLPLCPPAVLAPPSSPAPDWMADYAMNSFTQSVHSLAATPVPSQSAPAKSPAFEPRSRLMANQKSQPERSPNSWEQIWQQINRRRDQERSRTSRGDICPVVPQFMQRRVIWRDRPIFVWQGQVETITVSELGTPARSLWQQQPQQQTAIAYTGDPLPPGRQYVWQAQTGTQSTQVIFQTMGQAERDRITTQLAQLETQSAAAKLDPEARVKERMQFFLDQDLWLDAVQEAYMVTRPSVALQQFQRQLVDLSCRRVAHSE